MKNHQALLDKIGNSLEIELAFDDNRQCFLLLDEHLMVSIRSLEDAWVLYGMLGNLDTHEDTEGVAQALLVLNLELAQSGRASIVKEASSDVLMLVQRIDTTAMEGERMEEMLGHFFDTLSNTIAVLNGEQEIEAPSLSAPVFSEPGFFDRA